MRKMMRTERIKMH